MSPKGLGASKTQIWPGSPILADNGQNGQKWPKMAKNDQKMAQNHPKMTFFDFQSVYTQNDRNFALIMNLSVIFEKNMPKTPKMAKKGQNGTKSPKSDFF